MPLIIAVAGAGIGGLAAAIGLARNGHTVHVFERRSVSGGVGFSFALKSNTASPMAFLGVDPDSCGGVRSQTMRMSKASDGSLLQIVEEDEVEKDGKAPFAGYMSRSGLSSSLEANARKAGCTIETGSKVTGVDLTSNTLELHNGKTFKADVIIGADGIHSVVRKALVHGELAKPHCTLGQNCFRFTLPIETVRSDPDLASLFVNEGMPAVGWFGREKHIVAYRVDFGQTVSVACTHPARLTDAIATTQDTDIAADYNRKAPREKVFDIFSDFEPRVKSLLQMADAEGFRIWKLEDLDDIGEYSHGHTVLLGDACHSMLPGTFAGAASALEDGVTLAVLLDANVQSSAIEDRLRLYQEIRKPRVDRIRAVGRNQEAVKESRSAFADYYSFLTQHDAVECARQALEARKSGNR